MLRAPTLLGLGHNFALPPSVPTTPSKKSEQLSGGKWKRNDPTQIARSYIASGGIPENS